VPYDSGLAIVRDPETLRGAMMTSAPYLEQGVMREPDQFTPEMSRRARGVDIWAALRSLGRNGVADLIERCCRHATHFADGLANTGYEILNDVVLNQVLVSFGPPEITRQVIAEIQASGICWCGGTVWQGRSAMRISVSSWATTDVDVEQSLAEMIQIAANVSAEHSPPQT
jgi:glutamate/tyrosine decarboxylase-like PLP-dependent enzyme